MDIAQNLSEAKAIIETAQNILVLTHENPTSDSIGSLLSLYLGLSSLNKKVTPICPDKVTVGHSHFIGIDKVKTAIQAKNFIISLDYEEGSIEKVSYNIEGNKFNLVIEPRNSYRGFSQEKVHISESGVKADLIVIVDTIHLGGLKSIYENQKELFANTPIINIDRHPNNSGYGKINLIEAEASSTIEIVSELMSILGIRLNTDIASNILNTLFDATDNFQNPKITSRTFELAAACIKAGAKKYVYLDLLDQESYPILIQL